ncbi:hypothetical protein FRC06_009496 [Ceratobasidium sp. 370]|nr:hypothetical protein FRC06_009496 [Ceratobasidium sp. 370]
MPNPDPSFTPSETELALAPRAHRERTPPPLAQASRSEDQFANPNGFLPPRNETPPRAFRAELEMLGAPTLAEFSERRAKEIRTLQNARKSSPPSKSKSTQGSDNERDEGKGVKKLWSYSKEHQGLMFVMRASVQNTYLSRGPWVESDDEVVNRAKAFAKKHTHCAVDDIVTNDFIRTMMKTASQYRTPGQDEIRTIVKAYYKVNEGDIQTLNWLQDRHRCLYPSGNFDPPQFFQTDLVDTVLATLYFGTSRKLGYIFMDEILQDDNLEELQWLLTVTARARLVGPPEVPTIVDPSSDASRGPSLAAIAFAGINIYHALERLKVPSKEKDSLAAKHKKEFNESNYGYIWSRYVHELAKHPYLGDLRLRLLHKLKASYCDGFQRAGPPIGSDYMW